MYTTYTTPAIVLSREGVGEADVRVELFTKDFGLLRAKAAGARAEASKLRYALQTYTQANVALVRGNNGWRLTGADLVAAAPSEKEATARFARVALLVRALIAAEEPSPDIFALLAAHGVLATDAAELALVASILASLGYMSVPQRDTHEESFAYWCRRAEEQRSTLLTSVNNALAANHISQK